MNLFNKSFFRFALGFLSIIVVSIGVIVVVNSIAHNDSGTFACLIGCEK